MAEARFESPIRADHSAAKLLITDESAGPKGRIVGTAHADVEMGTSARRGGALVFSTSPGEWTVLGESGEIDLTHVRVVVRVTGGDAPALLAKVCALDFGDDMFPSGRAARTDLAGIAAEIVRDDIDESASYLLVVSRSFGGYLEDVLVDQAREFGIGAS